MSEPAEKMTDSVAEVAPVEQSVPETVQSTDWRDSLPAELRDNPTIRDTPSLETLAKRLIDSRSQIGGSIRVPSEDAPKEDWDKFHKTLLEKNTGLMLKPNAEDAAALEAVYQALGKPENASDYYRPEKWEGVTDERFGFLSDVAHKAGLSKEQFKIMADQIAAADNEYYQNYNDQVYAGIQQLKGEWGRAFDQKVDRALITAKQLNAPAGLIEAIESKAVEAETLRWLDNIATKFGGEGKGLINGEGTVNEHTPSELTERIQELTRKMLSMDVSDPAYKGLMDKRIHYAKMLANDE